MTTPNEKGLRDHDSLVNHAKRFIDKRCSWFADPADMRPVDYFYEHIKIRKVGDKWVVFRKNSDPSQIDLDTGARHPRSADYWRWFLPFKRGFDTQYDAHVAAKKYLDWLGQRWLLPSTELYDANMKTVYSPMDAVFAVTHTPGKEFPWAVRQIREHGRIIFRATEYSDIRQFLDEQTTTAADAVIK